MTPFDFARPTRLADAITLLQREDAHAVAGGTDIVLRLMQRAIRGGLLVALDRIPELAGMRRSAEGGVRIGATTTLREIERSTLVREIAPSLSEACAGISTVRIRNQGTLGGNLAQADPVYDAPPALLALDASLAVAGALGERSIALSSFFVDSFRAALRPGEVIISIGIPPAAQTACAVHVKYLPRGHGDRALVTVAVAGVPAGDGRWRDVRIAIGAAGRIPIRSTAAEDSLDGSVLDAPATARAAEIAAGSIEPVDDLRGSAEYKREMTRVWTRRALQRLAASASRDRGPA